MHSIFLQFCHRFRK